MNARIRMSGFLLAVAALSAVQAGEQTPLTYDRIDLASEARGDVENDILVAVLSSEMDGPKAAALAAEVNKTIAKAVERIKQQSEIKVQTAGYQTAPIYQKERIGGWRVKQSIRLESTDAAKLGGLLGELQQQLHLESIDYETSPQRRKEAENGLIKEALGAFRQRAELLTRELGRSRYRIVALRVDTGGAPVRPMAPGIRAMAAEAAAPVPIEAGTQRIEVNVSGTIELQAD
ncbi:MULTISPECIES: SIMPL domain-containing protein [Methylococcus]|jgi:predicted secreted protein|uniref:SIMPL domain-containing protein n=1 Tax=Methylococcus TaxID=413 RepID=UPI001C529C8C|nr:SIMPL domain-containing protein [Methylococcus capsulatus]QXP89763.1 SIMPL domain-containing protein [Methylococcus capsulatus]